MIRAGLYCESELEHSKSTASTSTQARRENENEQRSGEMEEAGFEVPRSLPSSFKTALKDGGWWMTGIGSGGKGGQVAIFPFLPIYGWDLGIRSCLFLGHEAGARGTRHEAVGGVRG